MLKEYTCILCPNGCLLEADVAGIELLSLSGGRCPKGEGFVLQELTDPQRNIASSVLVHGGELPLVSVRLSRPVPKRFLFPIMEEIRKAAVTAPVAMGAVIIPRVCGLDCDVIATKHVAKG